MRDLSCFDSKWTRQPVSWFHSPTTLKIQHDASEKMSVMSVWIVFDDFKKFMIKLFLLCHLKFIDIVRPACHSGSNFQPVSTRTVSKITSTAYRRLGFSAFGWPSICFLEVASDSSHPCRRELRKSWDGKTGHENEHGTLIRGHQKGYETIMKVKLYGTLGSVMGHHVEHCGFI